MLNIPEEVKELFMQDGIRKNFRVHFPNGERADLVNKDIIEESVKFTESTCSQQTLRFGLTEASVIEFECVDVENIAGMTIECGIEIDVSSLSRADREAYGTRTDDVDFPFYAVPYGVFVVDKCPRQADMKRRKVTGYTEAGVASVSVGLAGKNRNAYIDATALLEASWLDFKNLTEASDTSHHILGGLNSGGYSLDLAPVNNNALAYKSAAAEYDISGTGVIQKLNAKLVCYIDYGSTAMDELIPIVSERLMARIPAGYMYGGDPLRRLAENSQQGFYGVLGGLYPAAMLETVGINSTTWSAPIILKYNAVNIIDVKYMRDTPLYGSPVPDDEVVRYRLTIKVLTRLPRSFFWRNQGATVLVDCTDIVPYDMRQSARLYWGELGTNEEAGSSFLVEAGGEMSIPGLGTYYEYFDEEQLRKKIDASLEVRGTFGSVQRNGRTEERTLDASNPRDVPRSLIESVWYDELKTVPPGEILFCYKNQTEEYTGEWAFRDGGAYDLTGNDLLKSLADKTRENVEQLLTAFPGNTSQASYIPIDMTMKGLPWLEDGDAIRIETEDGEVIDSYILRHTISGVQNLVDDIEAQGGA